MAKARGYTVLSFLGTQLDARGDADRWHRWRPNVSLCQHEEHVVSRLVLVSDRRHLKLFNQVRDDLAAVSPETKVEHREAAMKDPWDFESVFDGLYALADELAFDPARDDLLVHMTTGTHVQQICLFLLAESRHLPARLLQTGPPRSRAAARSSIPPTTSIICWPNARRAIPPSRSCC